MSEIKSIRDALAWTQERFAEELGVTQSTISRFERGDLVPDKRTLLAARAIASRARGAGATV